MYLFLAILDAILAVMYGAQVAMGAGHPVLTIVCCVCWAVCAVLNFLTWMARR